MDVYLDAVFFSRLDCWILPRKGTGWNLLSRPTRTATWFSGGGVQRDERRHECCWQRVMEYPCASTFSPPPPITTTAAATRAHSDLSYDQLRDFYRSHYHPSNAIFMTFGDILAAEHQAVFEARALGQFAERLMSASRYCWNSLSAPLRVAGRYAYDENGGTDRKTHIVIGWLLGQSTNLEQRLRRSCLPCAARQQRFALQQALETTKLGQAPSPLCGLSRTACAKWSSPAGWRA